MQKFKVAIHCVSRANSLFFVPPPPLPLSLSHYPRASYLHKNCISVAHRGRVVASYEAHSIFRYPAESNFNVREILLGEKVRRVKEKTEGFMKKGKSIK